MIALLLKASVIVWREALEAILIVSLIWAFLSRRPGSGTALRFAGRGIWAGLGLSLALGAALLGLQEVMPEGLLEHFQTALLILCALLMTQMVFWMSRHARTLKVNLERELNAAAERDQRWPVFFIALSAVVREGMEAVIFLFGLAAESTSRLGAAATLGAIAGSIVAGVALALATNRALVWGFRRLSLPFVFKLTAVWLLTSAAALLVSAVERLEQLEAWPLSLAPLWDASPLIPERTWFGSFFRIFGGYRARPTATELSVWLAFWGMCALGVFWSRRASSSIQPVASQSERAT